MSWKGISRSSVLEFVETNLANPLRLLKGWNIGGVLGTFGAENAAAVATVMFSNGNTELLHAGGTVGSLRIIRPFARLDVRLLDLQHLIFPWKKTKGNFDSAENHEVQGDIWFDFRGYVLCNSLRTATINFVKNFRSTMSLWWLTRYILESQCVKVFSKVSPHLMNLILPEGSQANNVCQKTRTFAIWENEQTFSAPHSL